MVSQVYYVLPASLVGVTLVFNAFWRLLRSHLVAKYSSIEDIKGLGQARPDDAKIRGTAVVCGGSYAGLSTARVLHDHFERVVIIEPEEWLREDDARRPDSWNQQQKRARIVQYHSLQTTQPFVLNTLRYLFPAWDITCEESGIRIAPFSLNYLWSGRRAKEPNSHFGGSLPNAMFASRRALETTLRRRVLNSKDYPNIVQLSGQVTDFLRDYHRAARVAGVVYLSPDGTEHRLDAELVVDCTGTAQAGLKWLSGAGFDADIRRDTYNPKTRYATFNFKITPELAVKLPVPGGFYRPSGGYAISIPDASKDNKGLCIVRNEDNRLQVCCGSWGTPDTPIVKTVDGILAYCNALRLDEPLPHWVLATMELLREAEEDMYCSQVSVGPSYLCKFQESNSLPTNFVALGDAVCRVNPLYGHGFAKALAGATCLNTILNRTRDATTLPGTFSKDFFGLQANKIVPMWELPILSDYGQEATTPLAGEKKSSTDGLRWYLSQIVKLSLTDESAAVPAFLGVSLLGGAPMDLLHPSLIVKVLCQCLFSKVRQIQDEPADQCR